MSKKEILICEGKHCGKKSKDIVKELDLQDVEIRIVNCLDMCDCAQVALVKADKNTYLKSVHRYDKEQWKELFEAIKEEKNIKNLDFVKTI